MSKHNKNRPFMPVNRMHAFNIHISIKQQAVQNPAGTLGNFSAGKDGVLLQRLFKCWTLAEIDEEFDCLQDMFAE